ncbi:MAG: DEAD/DEAH box helicase [Alicyclobacillaceae bacterium]|nr:DEAD/DEAH box helicase [Alicyclobacillaceae bacterium]
MATAPNWPWIVRVPTGAGKTAAAILAWLWRALHGPEEIRQSTPRRLVYCLPQRTLVQQTYDSARRWLARLGMSETLPLHILMGGQRAAGWEVHPEAHQILIGTQDQLLSRALNRGYGMSRYRWPMHFALLNNDALWIIDEPQLFGDALATTAQLQAFRLQYGTYGPTHTVWLSATVDPAWLHTVDAAPLVQGAEVLELNNRDRAQLAARLQAPKPLHASGLTLTAKDAEKPFEYASRLAEVVAQVHRSGTLTLVIINRVARAQMVYEALKKKPAGRRHPFDPQPVPDGGAPALRRGAALVRRIRCHPRRHSGRGGGRRPVRRDARDRVGSVEFAGSEVRPLQPERSRPDPRGLLGGRGIRQQGVLPLRTGRYGGRPHTAHTPDGCRHRLLARTTTVGSLPPRAAPPGFAEPF